MRDDSVFLRHFLESIRNSALSESSENEKRSRNGEAKPCPLVKHSQIRTKELKMSDSKRQIVTGFAKMWPRKISHLEEKVVRAAKAS